MRLRRHAQLVFVIAMVIVSSRLTYPGESPLKNVTVAYTSYGPFLMPFLLEKDLGFFREEGLRPEFILVRGAGLAVKGLIAENFDYIVSASSVMEAVIRGRQPLRVIFTAGLIHYWVLAHPTILSVTDLKGKTIGTGSLGSLSDFTMREIFRRHGLDPFRDATLVGIGSSADRFAALTSGVVHATFLSPPFNFKAVELGYRKLASAGDYVKLPTGGLGTREEKILRDSQEVMKMVRASLKGLKFVLAEREYVLSRMMQMFRLSREGALQSYEALREEFVPSGYLSEEAERAAISLMKQAAKVTEEVSVGRVFDNRFVKQVELELKGWRPQIPK